MEEKKITIKVARTMAGLTQRELAEKLGVSRMAVWAWEKGENIPRLDYALKLCELADIPITALLLPSKAQK